RIFDILKPFPIRYFDEKLESGLGIMFDDILAAIFALISLHLLYYFI
ncbi:TPA: phosphatidylglycerophosphatase A, partial [Mannheimia haemolytica]|nr:phosphatidylglycerophosphatase A [Mannheimia haemolytica]